MLFILFLDHNFTIFTMFVDTMVRNGDVELQGREEEIRFLKMQLQEEKRSIDVIRKQLPNKKSLDQELVTLQIQVIIRLHIRL